MPSCCSLQWGRTRSTRASNMSTTITLFRVPLKWRFPRNWTFAQSISPVTQPWRAKRQGQRQYGIRVLVAHVGPLLRRHPRWLTCASQGMEPTPCNPRPTVWKFPFRTSSVAPQLAAASVGAKVGTCMVLTKWPGLGASQKSGTTFTNAAKAIQRSTLRRRINATSFHGAVSVLLGQTPIGGGLELQRLMARPR